MSRVIIQRSTEAGGGMVYSLGVIGALIYFFQRADTFMDFLLGLIQSLVWPGVFVYKIFAMMGV